MTAKTRIALIALLVGLFTCFLLVNAGRDKTKREAETSIKERQEAWDEGAKQAATDIADYLSKAYPDEFVKAEPHENATVAVVLDLSTNNEYNEWTEDGRKNEAQGLAADVFRECSYASYRWHQLSIVIKPCDSVKLSRSDLGRVGENPKYQKKGILISVQYYWSDYWEYDWV